jgi:hypothetical protein
MKHTGVVFLLTFCLLHPAFEAQQPTARSAGPNPEFVIDPSKPYVYLEVDHVGPRKPLRDGEPATGIWLRLKNNSRLPIVIMVLGASPSDSGEALSVVDEVVLNPQAGGEDGRATGILAQHGAEDMTDIFRFPNVTEAEIRSAEDIQRTDGNRVLSKVAEPPLGYNGGGAPIAPEVTMIPPGGQVLFSLPVNHVSEAWHFEIPFRFALKHVRGVRQPYSYVALYWDDISEADRSLMLKAKESGTAKPGNTTEPEVQHSNSSPH